MQTASGAENKMGILYYVACRDCGVCRDVDKLRTIAPANREQALAAAENLSVFRTALLVGFLTEHQGHNCTLFNDAADQDDITKYTGDNRDFWGHVQGDEQPPDE